MTGSTTRSRVPIREGLLTGDLDRLEKVRLAGSRCQACNEAALGQRDLCPNCGQDAMQDLALSAFGALWSYTVARHRPPGDYKGADPFEPFGIGMVELPDGLRVMTPLEGALQDLRIGQAVRFVPQLRQEDDREVVSFAFSISTKEASDV